MNRVYLLLIIGFILSSTTNGAYAQGISGGEVSQYQITKKVKLFPNPAMDRFSINMPTASVKHITINNIIGKEIKKINVTSNQSYDVSDLKRGVYIIRIFDPNDELIKALRLSKA